MGDYPGLHCACVAGAGPKQRSAGENHGKTQLVSLLPWGAGLRASTATAAPGTRFDRVPEDTRPENQASSGGWSQADTSHRGSPKPLHPTRYLWLPHTTPGRRPQLQPFVPSVPSSGSKGVTGKSKPDLKSKDASPCGTGAAGLCYPGRGSSAVWESSSNQGDSRERTAVHPGKETSHGSQAPKHRRGRPTGASSQALVCGHKQQASSGCGCMWVQWQSTHKSSRGVSPPNPE